ncbi:uncharacterized protein [Antennarius striatus]|uniref:uncharacterized protein n=1 Tax=Antennarius striatus TaxID=241820 RepID=UPI0035AF10B7
MLLRVAAGGPVPGEGLDPAGAEELGAPTRSFFHLPMFQDAPGPLVARELLRPGTEKRPLPGGLTQLLSPRQEPLLSPPEPGGGAVEVRCGSGEVSVRLDRSRLRAWTRPALFRLGSCGVSDITPRFLYFQHRLGGCDTQPKVVGGQLVYNFTLHYTPPPQDSVLRVLPLDLPVLCQYNRFHYSYQVGFKPQVQHKTFVKSLKRRLNFSLSVCNDQWEPLPPGHGFSLGEPVYFVAQAGALLAGEKLDVDSCYATSTRDQKSTPKLDIITNYGCMVDSMREGSTSQFLPAGGSVKFSVDAFLFRAVMQELYLHCSVSVGLTASHTSKSCNYNKTAHRWEEVEGLHPLCTCCDSLCTGKQDSVKHTVSSPGWFVIQEAKENPRMEKVPLQLKEAGGWLDQEEIMDEHLDKIWTFSQQIAKRGDHVGEQESISAFLKMFALPAESKESVSQKGKTEKVVGLTREVAGEQAEKLLTKLNTDGIFMSDQSRPEEDVAVNVQHEDPISALSTEENGTDAPRSGVGATVPGFGVDSAKGNNQASTTLIPNIQVNANSDINITPNLTIKDENESSDDGRDAMNTDGITESFHVGSVRDSGVNETTTRHEQLTLTFSATSNSGKDKIYGKNDVLDRLQITGIESDQSSHKFRDLDFDPENEGKALHLSQFANKKNSNAVARPHSVSSDVSRGSAVAVATNSESIVSDGDWAYVLPEWGLQTLIEVEELREDLIKDSY